MNQKNRTLRRLGIAGVATAMATVGTPALASAATIAPHTVKADAVSAPSAPSGLTATDAGLNMVTLSWKAPSGTVSGYNIYRSTASGGESGTNPVNGNVLVKGTSMTLTVPNSGTFYFQVAAVNAAGEGSLSNEAHATAAAVKPGAPSGVTATASAGAATLSWKAPSTGGQPTGYTVNYGTSASSLNLQATVGKSTTTTQIDNLTNGTEYYFDVVASNGAGSGSASSVVNATPGTNTVPPPPTQTAPTVGDGYIVVNWTPNNDTANGVTGYNVYEGTSAGGESSTPVNGSVPLAKTATSVKVAATNGKTEYFTVKAVNANGMSVASNEESATAASTAISGAPTAPQNLTATADSGAVLLKWAAPTTGGSSKVVKYEVLQGASGTNAATLSGTNTAGTTTSTSAIATGLTNSTAATFRVEAINAAGTPGAQATVSATPTTSSPAPVTAPQAVTVSSTGTASNTIKWTAPNYGTPTSYTVYRNGTPIGSTSGTGPFVDDGGTHTGQTDFSTDSAPVNGTTYSYKVTAVIGAGGSGTTAYGRGTSPAGGPASIKTGDVTPGAPTVTSASVPANGKVTLSWSAPSDLGAGKVKYVVLENGAQVGSSLASTSTTVTENGLSSTTSTNFAVEAKSKTAGGVTLGTSVPSNTVGVVAALTPKAPTSLTAAATSSTSVKLNWNAPSSPVTAYEVFQKASTASTFPASPTAIIGASTSYTSTGLTEGTTYDFEVLAENGTANKSSRSNIASATTTSSSVSTAPGAPTNLKASVNGGLVNLSWTAPSNAGASPITGYDIYEGTSSSTSKAEMIGSTSGTGTSAVLDNLGTSAVDLFVRAVNSPSGTANPGAYSAPVVVTPSSTSARPGAPSTPQVTVSGGKAFVVWTPPASNGSSPVTGYFVTAHLIGGKGKTVFVHGTSAAVGGLTSGTYYFTVVAVDSLGGGTPSAPSSFVKITNTGPQGNIKVYVTPPKMIAKAGVTTIRVTTNKPGVQVHLFDEAFGTSHFFQKKIMTTTAQANGTGVAIFKIGIARANHFFVVADGVKSNTVIARVK